MALTELHDDRNSIVLRPRTEGSTAMEWQRPLEYRHEPGMCPNYSIDLKDPFHPYLILDTYLLSSPDTVAYNEQTDRMLLIRVPFDDFISDVIRILGTQEEGKATRGHMQLAREHTQIIDELRMPIKFTTFQDPAHAADMLSSILLNDIFRQIGPETTSTMTIFSEGLLDQMSLSMDGTSNTLQRAKAQIVIKNLGRLHKNQSNQAIYETHVAIENLMQNDDGEVDTNRVIQTAMLVHQASLGFRPKRDRTFIGDRKQIISEKQGSRGREGCVLIIDYKDDSYALCETRYWFNGCDKIATIELSDRTNIDFNAENFQIDASVPITTEYIRNNISQYGNFGRLGHSLIHGHNGDLTLDHPNLRVNYNFTGEQMKQPMRYKLHPKCEDVRLSIKGNRMLGLDANTIIPEFRGQLQLERVGSVQIGSFEGTLIADMVGAELHAGKRHTNRWSGPGISIERMNGKIHAKASRISLDRFEGEVKTDIEADEKSEISIDGKVIKKK